MTAGATGSERKWENFSEKKWSERKIKEQMAIDIAFKFLKVGRRKDEIRKEFHKLEVREKKLLE